MTTLFWRKWAIFALVVIAFLAFFDLGSLGLASTGTCLGTCSEGAFLLEGVLFVEGFTVRECVGTYVVTCSEGAFPLVEVPFGEDSASPSYLGSYSEGPTGLGVFQVLWEEDGVDFLEDLAEGLQ